MKTKSTPPLFILSIVLIAISFLPVADAATLNNWSVSGGTVSGADTDHPTFTGNGLISAQIGGDDGFSLEEIGTGITFSGTMLITFPEGSSGANGLFRLGFFNSNGSLNDKGWSGYLAVNRTTKGTTNYPMYRKNAGTGEWSSTSSNGYSGVQGSLVTGGTSGSGVTPGSGTYSIVLSLTHETEGLLFSWTIQGTDNSYSLNGSWLDTSPVSNSYDRVTLQTLTSFGASTIEFSNLKVAYTAIPEANTASLALTGLASLLFLKGRFRLPRRGPSPYQGTRRKSGSLRRFSYGVALSLVAPVVTSAAETESWPPVPAANLGAIKPADFRDDELDMIRPLAHFAQVANAVNESGPERGFINIPVWRSQKGNRPYNARIMENVLSFAWFYTADRKWNPYRGHPAVRARLEAMLDYIAKIQAPDGAFSEYGEKKWNLAATVFLAGRLGGALELIAEATAPNASGGAVPFSAEVLARAHATERKALHAVLARDDYFKSGAFFTNQYSAVWPGGLTWLRLHPEDTELRNLWEKRFAQSRAAFQSPAGFLYEKAGPDFGYTLTTYGSNTRGAWPYIPDSLREDWIEREKAWFDWVARNIVPEPGESWIAINSSIETRQWHPFLDLTAPSDKDFPAAIPFIQTPSSELIPFASAISRTREEQDAIVSKGRAAFAANWPEVGPLEVGRFWAFPPHLFHPRRSQVWRPTEAERAAARAKLPQLARDDFNHARHDPRVNADFLYLRRPKYYATFAAGHIAAPQQRYGIGLLWRPDSGLILQSVSRSPSGAWGTYVKGALSPFEAASFTPDIRISGEPVPAPLPAAEDLVQGELEVAYPLGIKGELKAGGKGRKSVAFSDNVIKVAISFTGEFVEKFPLILAPTDKIEVIGDSIMVTRSGHEAPLLTISRGKGGAEHRPITLVESSTPLPNRRLVVAQIPASKRLDYTMKF